MNPLTGVNLHLLLQPVLFSQNVSISEACRSSQVSVTIPATVSHSVPATTPHPPVTILVRPHSLTAPEKSKTTNNPPQNQQSEEALDTPSRFAVTVTCITTVNSNTLLGHSIPVLAYRIFLDLSLFLSRLLPDQTIELRQPQISEVSIL